MGSFQNKARGISQKQHIPMKNAQAILAAGARNASPAAKRANPNLNKVKGSSRGSHTRKH